MKQTPMTNKQCCEKCTGKIVTNCLRYDVFCSDCPCHDIAQAQKEYKEGNYKTLDEVTGDFKTSGTVQPKTILKCKNGACRTCHDGINEENPTGQRGKCPNAQPKTIKEITNDFVEWAEQIESMWPKKPEVKPEPKDWEKGINSLLAQQRNEIIEKCIKLLEDTLEHWGDVKRLEQRIFDLKREKARLGVY